MSEGDARALDVWQAIRGVVPAAGVGRRMGAERPKQYLEIRGRTVLEHTLDRLLGVVRLHGVIVAVDRI